MRGATGPMLPVKVTLWREMVARYFSTSKEPRMTLVRRVTAVGITMNSMPALWMSGSAHIPISSLSSS